MVTQLIEGSFHNTTGDRLYIYFALDSIHQTNGSRISGDLAQAVRRLLSMVGLHIIDSIVTLKAIAHDSTYTITFTRSAWTLEEVSYNMVSLDL